MIFGCAITQLSFFFPSYHSILLLNPHTVVKDCSKEANLEVQLLSLRPPQLLGSPLARVPAVKRFEKPICSFSLGCWDSSTCTLTRDQLCCFFYTEQGSDYLFCSSMKGFIALGKQWIFATTVEELHHSPVNSLEETLRFFFFILKPLVMLNNESIFCVDVLNILYGKKIKCMYFICPFVWLFLLYQFAKQIIIQ